MQLYDLLRHCRSVIVLGSAGSGKTKLIHILERSLNIILSKHQKADPSQLSRLLTPADDFQRRSSRAYSRLGLNDGTNQDRLISLKTLFFEAVSKKHVSIQNKQLVIEAVWSLRDFVGNGVYGTVMSIMLSVNL